MPAAEVDVSVSLVRKLLEAQHPDIARLPLEVIANGWDNVVCRLGDDLIVRLPRREVAAQLVLHEQRWLPILAPRVPLPIPAPVRVGHPSDDYPWPWSVVPYLSGRSAAEDPPEDLRAAAISVGTFLGKLHAPAPPDAPINPFRGIRLADRRATLAGRIASLAGVIDQAAASRALENAVAVPPWRQPPVWLHGDFHPHNILVTDGAVSGVIDFGDLTSGDPATDLAIAWMLLPAAHRADFRTAYETANGTGIDADTWARAAGWGLAFALAFLANSADNPLMAGIGGGALAAVLA